MTCELCRVDGGLLVHRGSAWRVIRAADPAAPATYRLIWNDHVGEWTDLSVPQRRQVMEAVETIETVLRRELQPTKINLASLGNAVPHLHWHVIARFDWDSHFPQSVWGAKQREVSDAEQRLRLPLPTLDRLISAALSAS